MRSSMTVDKAVNLDQKQMVLTWDKKEHNSNAKS